jgi:hypothetical protein
MSAMWKKKSWPSAAEDTYTKHESLHWTIIHMDMIIFAETIPVMNTHLSNERHVEKEELA